jgi:transcriptional regulator with XRE-family HTH domain
MRKPRPRPARLAAKLLAVREHLGMSQYKLAQLLDSTMPYTRLSDYEHGKREPNLMLILQYARVAKVPVENLIDDNLDLHF